MRSLLTSIFILLFFVAKAQDTVVNTGSTPTTVYLDSGQVVYLNGYILPDTTKKVGFTYSDISKNASDSSLYANVKGNKKRIVLQPQVDSVRGFILDTLHSEQKPNTPLASMSINQGGVGYKVFNNFDATFARRYTRVKLNNQSASIRKFLIIKLLADGVTTQTIDSFNFPALSVTEYVLAVPFICLPNEKIGIQMVVSSFRGVASGDIGSRLYNGTSWSNSIITFGYSASYDLLPTIPLYDNIKKISNKVVLLDSLKADLGNVIQTQAPNTPLTSMSVNGGGLNWIIFNKFDATARREYRELTLNNQSTSARRFQIAKLGVDGTTVTLYDSITFPATAITTILIDTPIVCESGELLGIKCLEVGFRNTSATDIGTVYYNATSGVWANSPSTWGYTLKGKIITYGTLKDASDAIDDLKSSGSPFPKMLFSYDADGGTYSAGMFTVYVQFKEYQNYYAKFNIIHQLVDDIATPRSDLWRIYGATQCVYNPNANVMTETGKALLQSSETEYVVRFDGDDDSAGGFHGNEKLSAIHFFADSDSIPLGTDVSLKRCGFFEYLQQSRIAKRSEVTEHFLLNHTKRTTFIDDAGFETFNHLEVIDYPNGDTALNYNSFYSGLFTVTTTCADQFFSETGTINQALHNSTPAADKIMERRNQEITYWSNANGLGAQVSSYMRYAEVNGVDKTQEFNLAELELQVWDTNIYTKYYRRIQEPEISQYIFKIGDITESIGKINFKMKP